MTTKIEWTNTLPGYRGETWNPVIGCTKVSPGCDGCYAIDQAVRIQRMGGKGGQTYEGTTDGDDWSGLVKCLPERLDQPLRWSKPRLIFVNSMSDLFHPNVPAEFVVDVWDVMTAGDSHIFQILTKRPQRMAEILPRIAFGEYINADGLLDVHPMATATAFSQWPLPNVWLGTSIESDRYIFRADHLRRTPAAVRFLSLEPLLGPLPSLDLTGIDWVIVGGESGPGARPMHPDWVREIRDRCVDAGVPYFFKQWGRLVTANGDRQAARNGEVPDGGDNGKRHAQSRQEGRRAHARRAHLGRDAGGDRMTTDQLTLDGTWPLDDTPIHIQYGISGRRDPVCLAETGDVESPRTLNYLQRKYGGTVPICAACRKAYNAVGGRSKL